MKDGKQKRTSYVHVKVNEEEHRALKEKSKEYGISVGAYVRFKAIYEEDRKEV